MRLASEAPFPYGWPGRVCYFVLIDGLPTQINGRHDLRQAVSAALGGNERIYATWPGQFRSDLFLIDEPARLAEAIGLVVA